VALTAIDAFTSLLTDRQVDAGHVLTGEVLAMLGVAVALAVMWACSEVAVLVEPSARARAVLRWFPVLLVLIVSIPFLLDDVHALSTLLITLTP
jgi:hypothetical protein